MNFADTNTSGLGLYILIKLLVLTGALCAFVNRRKFLKAGFCLEVLIYLIAFAFPVATTSFCDGWNTGNMKGRCSFDIFGIMSWTYNTFSGLVFISAFTFGAPILAYVVGVIVFAKLTSLFVNGDREMRKLIILSSLFWPLFVYLIVRIFQKKRVAEVSRSQSSIDVDLNSVGEVEKFLRAVCYIIWIMSVFCILRNGFSFR